MNELLPYEAELNQQWIDLPLPDENMAWADMRRRLDEEDKKRVLPFWLTGCAGWALLGIALLGLGWWIVRPEKWFTNKQGTEKTDTLLEKNKKNETDTTYQYHQSDTAKTSANISGDTLQNDIGTNSVDVTTKDPLGKEKTKNIVPENNNVLIETGKVNISKTKKPVDEKGKDNIISKKKRLPGEKNKNDIIIKKKKENGKEKAPGDKEQPVLVEKETTTSDSLDIVIQSPTVGTISKTTQPLAAVDSPKRKPFSDFYIPDTTTKRTANKKPSGDSAVKTKRPFVFSAGLGLHQQLPVAGQTFVPYSSTGRKGSLRDYIPSLYIRLEKENKWFIQSGFRYGAPQPVKEFLYSRRSDTLSFQKYNDTNTYLKKTFYHQLPLTVNYFVLPNLSLGAGITWNKFISSVSSRDVRQIDRFNGGDTAISLGSILTSRGADSNFVNSYFQASIEFQYKWKRFTLGANYSFGLQPYIKFILPRGELQEEKNKSLNIFLRYELWRSKKK